MLGLRGAPAIAPRQEAGVKTSPITPITRRAFSRLSCPLLIQRLLIGVQLSAWLGRPNKGAGKATDNLAGLLHAKLSDPLRQRCPQLINALTAG